MYRQLYLGGTPDEPLTGIPHGFVDSGVPSFSHSYEAMERAYGKQAAEEWLKLVYDASDVPMSFHE